jgi:4-hydroxy-tetrahydrodipicolinate reductase
MGRQLLEAIAADPELSAAAAVDRPGHPELGKEIAPGVALGADAAAGLRACDVAIDFSLPAATATLVELAAGQGVPLVIGTTGLSQEQRARVEAAARRTPIVLSPNFSVGVNVLLGLVEQAARQLVGYDADVLELHHGQKVDAPSGTALALGRAVAQARGQRFEEVAVFERHGHTGTRAVGSIGLQALRLGDAPGEHTVFFAGPGERIELTSRAQ